MEEILNPRLEKNLNALAQKDPLLAAQLKLIEPNKKYEVYIGSDPLNINIYDKERKVSLFYNEPLVEIKEKIKEFELYRNYPFLYFFGIGNGIFYKMLFNNSVLKKVFVFEPELELIYIALNFADFSEEILSGKFSILWTKTTSFSQIHKSLNEGGQWIYSKVYNLHLYNNYYGDYQQECYDVHSIITRALEHHVLAVGNDSIDALVGLEHQIFNIPEMIHSPSLKEFVSKAKTTNTAVIVSTGPSLYKQLSLLKEYAPYVTIFCVDASFPILAKHNIKPDIVVTLERVEPTAQFFIQTPKKAQEGVIFALTSIVHQATTKAITKGVKTFSMRPFGYNRFFAITDYGYAGIGMSAANLAYEFIVFCGFERCIFIGQDLAFAPDGKTHSQDAIFGENETQYKPQDEINKKILVPAYGGKGMVETTKVWQMFLNFFEKDIADTPYAIEAINATEGGARIAGTKEMPFAKALECVPKVKKQPIKLNPPTKERIKANEKQAKAKVKELLDYGYKKKKEVEKLFLKVVKMTEELERLNKANKLEKIDFEKMTKILDEIDDIKENFKDPTFIQVFSDVVQSYIVHQELDLAKILVKPVTTLIEKQVKQIDWLYTHKFWLFSLAGGMNATLEIVKRSAKNWMKLPKKYEEKESEK